MSFNVRGPGRATQSDVQSWRTTLSNWGRWGPDDRAGTLNHITNEQRLGALELVQVGQPVSCARPIVAGGDGEDVVPALHLMVRTHSSDAASDFLALAPHGFGVTHIDALGHFSHEGRGYNGVEVENSAIKPTSRLGVEILSHGIVGRGVLLDIPTLRQIPFIDPGEPIFADELDRAAASFGVSIKAGDTLLIRTGRWAKRSAAGRRDASLGLAGLDPSALTWLHDSELAVLGSDGVNDVVPSRIPEVRFPIHEVGLVSLGMHLLDNLDLENLASACALYDRYEFLFLLAPLVITHGTSSPVNPLALF